MANQEHATIQEIGLYTVYEDVKTLVKDCYIFSYCYDHMVYIDENYKKITFK
jgi:hypothetical protein